LGPLALEESSLNLLRELSDSFGPSGFERETAGIVKREAQKYADEITFDKLGSLSGYLETSGEHG
jgi:putative aminopeptidase FrvX